MVNGLGQALHFSGTAMQGAVGYLHDTRYQDGVFINQFDDFCLVCFWVIQKLLELLGGFWKGRQNKSAALDMGQQDTLKRCREF